MFQSFPWLVMGAIIGIVLGSQDVHDNCNVPGELSLVAIDQHPIAARYNYSADDIVCGVITAKKYHASRAIAVKETWGRRCGLVLYIDAEPNEDLPVTVIEGSEEGKIINKKTIGLFTYLWKHHSEKKWFVKADDDTYIVFENLLALLSQYNYQERHYIGQAGEWTNGQRKVKFCPGGAGYVLSQQALREWYPKIPDCVMLPVGEDVTVADCLKKSIDLEPTTKTGFYHKPADFFFNTAQGIRNEPNGLTIRPITFHSMTPPNMRLYDYLIYNITSPVPSHGKWSDPWPISEALETQTGTGSPRL